MSNRAIILAQLINLAFFPLLLCVCDFIYATQRYQWTTSGELNESVGPAVHHVQGSQEEQAEYAIIGFPETNRVYLHSFLHSLVAPLTIVRLDRVTVLLTTTATSPWPLSSDNDRVTFNIGGCVPDHLPYVLCTQRDV